MKKALLMIPIAFALNTLQAHAVTINIDIDIATDTKYPSCEKFAKRIRELVANYVQTRDVDEKAKFAERIKKKKKKLKRCEKDERSLLKRVGRLIQGGSVSVSTSF